MITAANADQLQSESADPEYSFADEMVSTALVDLGKSRISSAIVHAVIALESASKQAFERCVREKLPGFEKGGTVEAVSKELSVVAFARPTLSQLASEEIVQEIDWAAVQQLYDARNTLVHKSRRRFPEYEAVKTQILEVMKYVNRLESAAASLLKR